MASENYGSAGRGPSSLVVGDTRKAPRYGQIFCTGAFRKGFAAYHDRYTYVEESIVQRPEPGAHDHGAVDSVAHPACTRGKLRPGEDAGQQEAS